jgi:hypothetical protein
VKENLIAIKENIAAEKINVVDIPTAVDLHKFLKKTFPR